MKLQCLTICLLLFCNAVRIQAQRPGETVTSLSSKELKENIQRYKGNDSIWPYLTSYLAKAKKRSNWKEVADAYRRHMYAADQPLQLAYADSMLFAAEKTDKNEVIGDAYLTRGILYYSRKEHDKALENYIVANRYIASTENLYLRYKIKYNMGLIKYYLGYYNEALSLFTETASYYKARHTKGYINSLHNLGLCYNQLNEIDASKTHIDKALQLASESGYTAIMPHLQLLQGVNNYYTKEHQRSLQIIKKIVPRLQTEKDFAALAVANYYLGRNYWAIGEQKGAVSYFKKVDTIARAKGYVRPDLRDGYELLIDYYRDKGDLQTELKYVHRLLEIDKVFEKDFRYLSTMIYRQYDTYSLVEQKDRLEKELRKEQLIKAGSYIIIGIMGLTVLLSIYNQITVRARYKKRFDELMHNKSKPVAIKATGTAAHKINPDVVAKILEQLNVFEQDQKFRTKDIRADDLARQLGTNSKYLTRVIRFYRDKNFTDYINDLRVDYIADALQSQPKLRHYTNLALAEEAGFSTAQHFTRAFGSRIKMPPSFFIQELDKISKGECRTD